MKSQSSKKFSVHSWSLQIMAPDPREPFEIPSKSFGVLAISLPWLSPWFLQDSPRCGEPLPLLPLCLAFCLSQLHSPILQEASPHHSGPFCTTISTPELLIPLPLGLQKILCAFILLFPCILERKDCDLYSQPIWLVTHSYMVIPKWKSGKR